MLSCNKDKLYGSGGNIHNINTDDCLAFRVAHLSLVLLGANPVLASRWAAVPSPGYLSLRAAPFWYDIPSPPDLALLVAPSGPVLLDRLQRADVSAIEVQILNWQYHRGNLDVALLRFAAWCVYRSRRRCRQ